MSKHDILMSEDEKKMWTNQKYETLIESIRNVCTFGDYDGVLKKLFYKSLTMTGAVGGYVAFLSRDGAHINPLFLESGEQACNVGDDHLMTVRGMREKVYKFKRVICENDFINSSYVNYLPEDHIELRNVLFAPIIVSDAVVGMICHANKPTDFDKTDEEILEIFAHLMSISYANHETLSKLKSTDFRFKKLLESVPEIGVTLDFNGNIKFANPFFVKMSGYSQSEIINMNWFDNFVLDDDREDLYSMFERFKHDLKGVLFTTHENKIKVKNGSIKNVFWTNIMTKSDDDSDFEITSLGVDLTDKALALQAAENANRLKSEFLANMSHELRTPLNGIMGMLQLLRTTPLNIEQKEYTEICLKSCGRLTGLLSDILDLSKIESGKLEINKTRFDVDSIFKSILDLFQIPASKDGVNFIIDIDDSVPEFITTDKHRLRQILFNVVGNAVKFSPNGTVRLSAKMIGPIVDDYQRILFTVEDNGIGISDEQLQYIFESFRQGESSFTRRFQGAGLGLTVVVKLLLLLNGDMSVDNSEGSTVFYISIPVKINGNLFIPESNINHVELEQFKGKILLVEDDLVNRITVEKMLEKCGLDVVSADNGSNALKLLSKYKNKISLILMDVQMPIMDGVTTTKKIRNSIDFVDVQNIPIVAITAYTMVGDKEKFLNAGMNDYLAKPIDYNSLQKVLNKHLNVE